ARFPASQKLSALPRVCHERLAGHRRRRAQSRHTFRWDSIRTHPPQLSRVLISDQGSREYDGCQHVSYGLKLSVEKPARNIPIGKGFWPVGPRFSRWHHYEVLLSTFHLGGHSQ